MTSLKQRHSRYFILMLFMLASLTGCRPLWYTQEPAWMVDGEAITALTIEYANELQHARRLHFDDAVVFFKPYGQAVDRVRLKFSSQDVMELREARELLVDVAEGLINRLNDSVFVGYEPLNSNNVEIYITFESYLGLYVDKLYIHRIVLEEGMSYFHAFDLTNEFNIWERDVECWHQRVEPYYKTLQFVTYQRIADINYELAHPKKKPLFNNAMFVGFADEREQAGKEEQAYSGAPDGSVLPYGPNSEGGLFGEGDRGFLVH